MARQSNDSTSSPPIVEQAWLTLDEVAGLLKVCKRTVRDMIKRQEFPPPDIRRGKRIVRYKTATVARALAGRRKAG